MALPAGATGTITLDGITSSSNTMTDDQMRESLGASQPETPTPTDSPTEPSESTPAPAPSESTPDLKPAASVKKKDPTKDPETRISKATYEREEARRELAREQAERQRIEREYHDFRAKHEKPAPDQAQPTGPAQDAEPRLEDFSDSPDPYAAYMRACAKYDLKQELAQREQAALQARTKFQQEQTAKQREQAEQTRIASFGQKLTQAMSANPDLEAQMAASDIEITRPMADAIIESETPHTLIAHLLANPAEVDRIVALSPLQQFRALARLDAQLEPASSGDSGSAVPKPKTAAQPPIRPVSGSHAAPAGGAPDPATCSQEEWDAYYNAQEKEARKAGRRR